MPRSPRILLFSRQPYVVAIARLPKPLSEAGFEVGALCTSESFLSKTKYLDAYFPCPESAPGIAYVLTRTVSRWKPNFIVPGDTWSLRYLQRMAVSPIMRRVFPSFTRLLEFSLGPPSGYSLVGQKPALQALAVRLGLPTPQDRPVREVAQAAALAEAYGYPVVLKKGAGAGGRGVWICEDRTELEQAFERWRRHRRTRKQSLGRAVWRRVRQIPFASPPLRTDALSIQRYIVGRAALYSFVAVEGQVLAGNVALRHFPYPHPTSPPCLYEAIEHAALRASAESVVAEVGFSGFGGFDFIIEDGTEEAYLLECNPLPESIAHLGRMLGADLCEALHRRLTGLAPRVTHPESRVGTHVVLFPHEWRRDPKSEHIVRYPHDVPLDDPSLLDALCQHFEISYAAIRKLRAQQVTA